MLESPHRTLVIGAAMLLATVAASRDATAQTLQGRILDEEDQRPLPQAIVRLLERDGEPAAVALADDAGRYSVQAPEPGEYTVTVEALGYETTRSPLLALSTADATYPVDLTLVRRPLGLPGFTVTAERFEAIERRVRSLIGVSPSSLRVEPMMRPQIEEHLARGHNVTDLMRWSNIPSMLVETRGDGPCFSFRAARSCVGVYLNGVLLQRLVIDALPLDLVETVVIIRPTESILYPAGAVLLYTREWIGGP